MDTESIGTYILYASIIILFIILLWYLTVTLRSDTSPHVDAVITPILPNSFPFPIFIVNLDRSPDRYQYMTDHLNSFGLTGYKRWQASDGSKIDPSDMITAGVNKHMVHTRKGGAGCSMSHIQLWRYMVKHKIDWTLILEDDALLHPQFLQLFHHYWNKLPQKVKIFYLGYCDEKITSDELVFEQGVICTHAYMLSWQGAKYLLDKLVPLQSTIDGSLKDHFSSHSGSYIANCNITIDNITPSKYRGGGGIIYQNTEKCGSVLEDINWDK